MTNKIKPNWQSYLESLHLEGNGSLWMPKDLAKRLHQWRARFDVYAAWQHDPSFAKLKNWHEKNSINREGEKLKQALKALKELAENEDRIEVDKASMNSAAVDIAHIQLLKLEIVQLKMLEKAQGLKRYAAGKSIKDLEANLDEFRKNIRLLETRKSQLSRSAHIYQLTQAESLFLSHEKRIHLNKYYKKSDKATYIFNVMNAYNHLMLSLSHVSVAIFNFLLFLGIVTQAVPIIQIIVSVIPILIQTAKVWSRNYSRAKKIASIFALVLLAGGIISGGLFTVAAGGIAIGLMTLSLYVNKINPWLRYMREIKNKKNERLELIDTIAKIRHGKKFTFSKRERQFLMVKLEDSWNSMNAQTRMECRQAINKLSYTALYNHSTIQQLTNTKLNLFLIDEMQKRRKDLKSQIADLTTQRKDKQPFVINSSLAIVGLILIVIPTPITMILGSSILICTAIAGLGLTFNWGTKLKNLYNKIIASSPLDSASTKSLHLNTHRYLLIHTPIAIPKPAQNSKLDPAVAISSPRHNTTTESLLSSSSLKTLHHRKHAHTSIKNPAFDADLKPSTRKHHTVVAKTKLRTD